MILLKKYKMYKLLILSAIFLNGLGFVINIGDLNIVIVVAALSISAIILNIIQNPRSINRLIKRKNGRILFLFLAWIIYAFIQYINVVDIQMYQQGCWQLITNSVAVILTLYLADIDQYMSCRSVLNAVYGVLIVNVLLGMFEVLSGLHFVEASSVWEASHARGFSENPNEYATTVFCSLMGVILMGSNEKLKAHHYITMMMAFLCIASSNSRGIILAVIVFVLCYAFMKLNIDLLANKGKWMKIAFWTIFVILIVAVMFVGVEKIILKAINMYSEGNSISDLYRWSLIKQGMKMFTDSMGLGVGPGQSIALAGINLHNFVIEILSEYGIIIFVLVMSLIMSIWNTSFNVHLAGKKRAIYFAYVPSMLIAGISSSSFYKFKMVWIVLVMFYLLKDSPVNDTENGRRK